MATDTLAVDKMMGGLLHNDGTARMGLCPKISQNVNYTHRGTMEGPKAPSEARRREAPECRGGGVWGGAP